jgi:hypothetical protein
VRKAAGKALGRCCLMLAQFAFAEYSRSAATSATVTAAAEPALFPSHEDVIKHPGIFDADGVEVKAQRLEMNW